MTPEQIALVRSSWRAISNDGADTGTGNINEADGDGTAFMSASKSASASASVPASVSASVSASVYASVSPSGVPPRVSFAEAFYDRLFALDPGLRALFADDMRAQHRKLTATLALVVNYLDQPTRLAPQVQALGRRHSGYGISDAQYRLVGQALLATLRDRLGEAFDGATERAWAQAYDALSDAMRTADIDSALYTR